MNKKRTLVTAALPYANGPIHLGHIAGAYLPADIYVRFKRLTGDDVLFICGSDEHGVPITITADKENITPQEVVDRYHSINKEAFNKLNISFDNYSRTSLPLHHEVAKKFFMRFFDEGILVKKSEMQFYDEKSGKFLPDRYIKGTCPNCKNDDARGDQCENCGTYLNPSELINPTSRISGEIPVLKETTHWYFPLGKYQKRLEDYIKEKDAAEGWKENVLNYCKTWFNDGLQDRAVTRDLDWGVKLPINNSENKVLYVWFDAVLGYISSTMELSEQRGEPDLWKKYWLNPDTKYYAFIGKDNVVFHCIVFPAMLMAWNDSSDEKYILPDNVPANEFLNYEGLKFSKSRGWGVDVQDFLKHFPADSLRYYLATILPENRDSDFYWKDFQSKYNNELADIFGNFVNRTLTFIERYFDSAIPEIDKYGENELRVLNEATKVKNSIAEYLNKVKIREALNDIMNLSRTANKYFNDSEPWKTIKSDKEKCAVSINLSAQLIRTLCIMLEPFIPEKVKTIQSVLNINSKDLLSWDQMDKPLLSGGHKIGKAEIFFKKIEDKEIEPFIPKDDADKRNVKEKNNSAKPEISIDDFKKIDIMTAEIVEATKVQKSDKLLKLIVKAGEEQKQVLAGISKFYKPEELIGKKVLMVANLKKSKIMGEISEGMILAIDIDNTVKVIQLQDDVPSGKLLR